MMVFSPADILLPRAEDLAHWAVVACDQFTSQPDYWARVEAAVGDRRSALGLILPEWKLEGGGVDEAIRTAQATMREYAEENYFTELKHTLIYVERTLSDGRVRRGVIGKLDLEHYDHRPDASALVRATEGTVLERIPPRLAVRRGALLELPHVLLLIDDPERRVIEPIAQSGPEPLYTARLMEGGGSVAGWRLGADETARVLAGLDALADPARFAAMYHAEGCAPMVFAVGDGNHSLAAAKAYYEELKAALPPGSAAAHPARYALVELGNLHDDSLSFEPIHRVVFGVKPESLLAALTDYCPDARPAAGEGHILSFLHADGTGEITVPSPPGGLVVGTLQHFLDDYTAKCGGRIDYIHGDGAAAQMGRTPGAVAFFLPPMEKGELFPAVMFDGVLPRKTFSMGHAEDKRYYLEARRIG